MKNVQNKFIITQTCKAIDRPPISFHVREYFEKFVIDNILVPKKIILSGKFTINIVIIFMEEGKHGPKGVYAYKPSIVTASNVKFYPVQLPLEKIRISPRPFLQVIELLYEALKVFFTKFFKKISPDFIDDLWVKVDLDYLLSLPYPAEIADQKYIGDTKIGGGTVMVQDREDFSNRG